MKLKASSCHFQLFPFAASRELSWLLLPEGVENELDTS